MLQQNAIAALGSEYSRVGKVLDISLGGLAFEYIIGEQIVLNSTKLDIYLVGNIFHLSNIPCRIIYDIQIHMPYVNNNLIKVLTNNRCGLKFDKLSRDESLQLKLFIENDSEKFFKQTDINP